MDILTIMRDKSKNKTLKKRKLSFISFRCLTRGYTPPRIPEMHSSHYNNPDWLVIVVSILHVSINGMRPNAEQFNHLFSLRWLFIASRLA